MNKKELGIYVHIPFCKHKCYYCDFVSYANKEVYIEKYIEAVIKEIKNYDLKEYIITSIYIGGGTPSYIKSEYIEKIIKTIKEQFCVDEKDCEFTIEVNPGTIKSINELQTYKNSGINRLSIGLQSTNDKLLKQIGRIHNYSQFVETYNMARKVGFKNINVDLIIGIPNQTIGDIQKEIEDIIKLNPEHISTYSLIVEEGTVLEKMLQEGKYKLPSESLEREMYWYVKNTLEKNGYIHYEISNFAKKGKESRHNKNCWEQKEYIGIGVAAHSYMNSIRYSNVEDIEKYIGFMEKLDETTKVEKIQESNLIENKCIQEKQTKEDTKKEYMLLGLRKIEGVSIKKFENKFAENPLESFKGEISKLKKEGLLEVKGDKIQLTNKGIDFANLVWEEFV